MSFHSKNKHTLRCYKDTLAEKCFCQTTFVLNHNGGIKRLCLYSEENCHMLTFNENMDRTLKVKKSLLLGLGLPVVEECFSIQHSLVLK